MEHAFLFIHLPGADVALYSYDDFIFINVKLYSVSKSILRILNARVGGVNYYTTRNILSIIQWTKTVSSFSSRGPNYWIK